MKILFETPIPRSYLDIKKGFTKDLFLELTPPGLSVELQRFDGCSPGDEVHLLMKSFGLKQMWISRITAEELTSEEWSFVDEGFKLPWPLDYWKHHHRVIRTGAQSSSIIDDIHFKSSVPGMDLLMYPILWAVFAIRPMRYQSYFERNS